MGANNRIEGDGLNTKTPTEPPVNQLQALDLLRQAGKAGDKAGFKPVSFDPGILGGAAAGAFAAEEILKDHKHKLFEKFPNRPPDKVTDVGAQVWNNPGGKPAFVEMQSGARFKFDYKNNHLSQVTMPDGSYYNCKNDLKKLSPDDTNFDQSREQIWVHQSRVNKSLQPTLDTMNISVDPEDGSVQFNHRNGAQETFTGNGFEVDLNPEKEINRVIQSGGDLWTFDYNLDHDLSRITKKSATEANKVGEIYAPTTTKGLWSETTPTGPVTGYPMFGAVRDPETGNIIIATTERAMVFTTDGGKSEVTWKQLQKQLKPPPKADSKQSII